MSILILGDVHLGKSSSLAKQVVGSALNSRVIDQSNLLEWTLDRAIERNVKHIILTGDVFEEPKPHYSLVVLFLEWLRKCSDESISVHIVAGNHDILRSGQFTTSPLDIVSAAEIPEVFAYKRISTLHLDGVGITFMPFRDRRSFNTDLNSEAVQMLKAQLPYEVSSIDDNSFKVLVGHLALEGAIPVGYELDELANELFCPLSMFKGYDFVFMGHIHKFQVMSQSPHISHIGSMDISDFGEEGHEKFIAILDTSRNEACLEHIKLPTRRLKQITISVPENLGKNVNQFIEEEINALGDLKDTIVRVSIQLPDASDYSVDRTLIEKRLYQKGVFHSTRISEERKFVSLKKTINEQLDNTVNEASAIKTYSSLVEEILREDFVSLASDLVQEFKESNKH